MIPKAEIYSNFRRENLAEILTLREPADFHEPIPISERLVQAIWSDQLFNSENLKTRDGLPVRVIHPGRWNEEGGPDFTGAQVEIGGQRLQGDVEVHLHATGWNEHGHALDPLYRRVILDVCLWDPAGSSPAPLLKADGRAVPQLVLHPHLQSSLEELVESLDPDSYPFSPRRITASAGPLQRLAREEILNLAASAGRYRFERKSARIQEAIQEDGEDQAAYRLLAEALGYKHNQRVFRRIAEALPLKKLLKPANIDEKIEALLAEATLHPLRVSQVRPANHPERRLAALALLAHLHPNLDGWLEELTAGTRVLKTPPLLEHPFWSWHTSRHSRAFKQPVALIGKTRWLEIATNIILPFTHAQKIRQGQKAEALRLLEMYLQLPAPQINLLVRRMAYDLNLPQPRKAHLHQGLIQIYQDFDLIQTELSSAKS